jgi:hypothetical protein
MLNSQLEGGRQFFSLPLWAVVQRDADQYVSPMVNALEKYAQDRSHSDGPEFIACQCPACKMISWQKSEPGKPGVCPFCSSVEPDYLTRIVPEPVSCDGAPGACESVSPFVVEFFMVQGSGFRCMAYRNDDGKWHGAFDDEELPGAIRVLG